MAYSYQTYTFSGSKTFNVAFPQETGSGATSSKPYISTAHLKVEVNGVAETDFTVDDAPSTTTVTLGAGVSLTNGDKVRIYRETPREIANRTVDFVNASILTESDLDLSAIHEQFIIQEALDTLETTLQKNANPMLDQWDLDGKIITNSATPTSASHLVNKDYVDTQAMFQGAASAQAWELADPDTGDSLADGSTRKFELADPDPSGTANELYITEVDGIMQSPSSEDGTTVRDYSVFQDTDGLYYLQFEDGSFPSGTGTNCPPNGAKITVQNMGISKSTLTGQLLFESGAADETPLTLKAYNAQTGDLFVVKGNDDSVLFRIAADGSLDFDEEAAMTVGKLTVANEGNAANRVVQIQRHPSQSQDMLSFQASGGAGIGTHFDKDAKLRFGGAGIGNSKIRILTGDGDGGIRIKAGVGEEAFQFVCEDEVGFNLYEVSYLGGVWKNQFLSGKFLVYKEADDDVRVLIYGDSAQVSDVFNIKAKSGNSGYSLSVDAGSQTRVSKLLCGKVSGNTQHSNTTGLVVYGHTVQNNAMVVFTDGDNTSRFIWWNDMDSTSVGARMKIIARPAQTGPVIIVEADESTDDNFQVYPNGRVFARSYIDTNDEYRHKNKRVYGVCQAGAFYANNLTRGSLTYGENIGSHSYTYMSDTATRVNLGTTMPDTDYKVRAFNTKGNNDDNTSYTVIAKTTTTFVINHEDDDVSNHPQVKWELLY